MDIYFFAFLLRNLEEDLVEPVVVLFFFLLLLLLLFFVVVDFFFVEDAAFFLLEEPISFSMLAICFLNIVGTKDSTANNVITIILLYPLDVLNSP